MSREPIHILFRQYRIAPLIITGFFMVLLWDMWQWFQGNHTELKDWTNTSFSALALAALGAVKWSLEQFFKKIERDDHDRPAD